MRWLQHVKILGFKSVRKIHKLLQFFLIIGRFAVVQAEITCDFGWDEFIELDAFIVVDYQLIHYFKIREHRPNIQELLVHLEARVFVDSFYFKPWYRIFHFDLVDDVLEVKKTENRRLGLLKYGLYHFVNLWSQNSLRLWDLIDVAVVVKVFYNCQLRNLWLLQIEALYARIRISLSENYDFLELALHVPE